MRLNDKDMQYNRLKEIAQSKDGILLSTEFITAKTKYTFKCHKGHTFELTADKVTSRGDWCPWCAGRYGDFHDKYKNIIENIHHGKMLSDYISTHKKIKCECEYNHVFYISPANLGGGKWCPYCNLSHGEEAIKYYLDNAKISYKIQFTFSDLKDNDLLPFDFAVFKNNKLACLIEFDGEQHLRPMRFNDKDKCYKKFIKTQLHDKMKNDYCRKNNIPLIRISCLDVNYRRLKNLQKDISDILDVELILYL